MLSLVSFVCFQHEWLCWICDSFRALVLNQVLPRLINLVFRQHFSRLYPPRKLVVLSLDSYLTDKYRFVIESAKGLQPDPAEASARSLLLITQTLLSMSGNSQSASSLSGASEDPRFTASASTICVNVLWFLSLSLSVAVSLVAMLAKEWCYSYMSGRTGHPCQQARRRQQRWDGLVRWRMQELLVFLPSLIHLALCECLD